MIISKDKMKNRKLAESIFGVFDVEDQSEPIETFKDEESAISCADELKDRCNNGVCRQYSGRFFVDKVESLKESVSKKEVIDAIISEYGCSKAGAEKLYKEFDNERKELLVKGFKDNAKKSFLNDSLKESKKGFVRKYRGCSIHDAGSTFVCTNEHGLNIGESKTEAGCEGIIDDYLDKKKNESIEEDYTQEDIIDWLSDHKQAFEDAKRFFKKDLREVDTEDLKSWISDHETLAKDFERFFGEALEEAEDVEYVKKYYANVKPDGTGEVEYSEVEEPKHSRDWHLGARSRKTLDKKEWQRRQEMTEAKSNKEKDVKSWWKSVEDWNRKNGNIFNIDNDENDIDGMYVAIWDMMDAIKDDAPDLYEQGRKIYRKYRVPTLKESLQESTNTKINIRESLNKIDWDTDNQYDLRNMYDSALGMSKEDKIKLAKMIFSNESYRKMYNYLKKFI